MLLFARKSPTAQTNRILLLLVCSAWITILGTINLLGFGEVFENFLSGARDIEWPVPAVNLQAMSMPPLLPANIADFTQTKPTCDGIHVHYDGPKIPIVYTVLNRDIPVIRKTVPFMCKFNPVIILTNVPLDDFLKHTCAKIYDVSKIYDKAQADFFWPSSAPTKEKIFFTRWYVLRDWMAASKTNQVLAIDSDILIYKDISRLVQDHAETFCRSSLWLIYEPPRVTQPYLLITLPALQDVTKVWNELLQPSVWTEEFIYPKRENSLAGSPTDVIAMGHYAHLAVGAPYPCWGLGEGHAAGTCDDTSEYAHTLILDRLRARGVSAKYKPESLTFSAAGGPAGDINALVDHDFWKDEIGAYAMAGDPVLHKQLRYRGGVPELRRRGGEWVEAYGLIMEDELEECVKHHVALAVGRATCTCEHVCCDRCL